MNTCDKCALPIDAHDGFSLRHPILGSYRICTGCSLPLDRFVDAIDKAKARRAARTRDDEIVQIPDRRSRH